MGHLLSQQLVTAGEHVVDVPATLAARTRLPANSRTNRPTMNDALSVAITAQKHRTLRDVVPAGHSELLRFLAKRNTDIGGQRCRLVSRLHALLIELAPGGIAKEVNPSDVVSFMAKLAPSSPVEQVPHDLAVDLLDDIRRFDEQLKASHQRIRTAITASSTTLTDVFGIGPIIAAALIGHSGDITRFRDRDHYAAYNGTTRLSSHWPAGRSVGCRSAGIASSTTRFTWLQSVSFANRTPTAAPTSSKVAEGKTKKEVIRSLKRQLSNVVYCRLVADACRDSG